MCALFFIKKGFPFISILNGGFAAAHAWLSRDCDYLSLPKVLVEYDEKSSLFADLERAYQSHKEFSNASTRKKTSIALQKLIDNYRIQKEESDLTLSMNYDETAVTDDSKNGLNKAFSGFKNIRISRPPKEKSGTKKDPLTFDFSKITFSRKLTKPSAVDVIHTNKDSTSSKSNTPSNNSFNPLKNINFETFSKRSSQSITREEESLFFDEETLDDTDDLFGTDPDDAKEAS